MHWKVLAISTLLSCFSLFGVLASKAATEANERFALKLSASAGLEQPHENVAVSPLLVQTSLALLYYGASSDTAHTLRTALELQRFATPALALTKLQELISAVKIEALQPVRLNLINAIYTQERYTYNFKDEFGFKAERLNILTERLDFGKSSKALDHINYAFLARTNYTIGEVITTQMLNDDDPLLLVSAAVLKAPWAQAFDVKETEKLNFHTDMRNHKLVDMMFVSSKFKYAELNDLDAKAIELPFDRTKLRLLIILPNKVNGLSALEQKLKGESLSTLTSQMSETKIALTMPKLRLEQANNLKAALMQCGLSNIFSSAASFPDVFSTLLASSAPHVTAVPHKVLLELDEAGGDAGAGFSFGDLFKRTTQLLIDHPFYFAVRTEDAVLLAGHVAKI